MFIPWVTCMTVSLMSFILFHCYRVNYLELSFLDALLNSSCALCWSVKVMEKASDGWRSTLIDVSAEMDLCDVQHLIMMKQTFPSATWNTKLLLGYYNLIFFLRSCCKPAAMLWQFEMCRSVNGKADQSSLNLWM